MQHPGFERRYLSNPGISVVFASLDPTGKDRQPSSGDGEQRLGCLNTKACRFAGEAKEKEMRKSLLVALAIGTSAVAMTDAAHAYAVTMYTGNTAGTTFNASADSTFGNATGQVYTTAKFDYNGPLSFQVGLPQNSVSAGDLNSSFFSKGTITNYTGSGVLTNPANADFRTLTSFLASSGSASSNQYGSLMILDLGVLSAGTFLSIDHDDGASVYQNGVRIGNTTAGPTAEILETVRLTSTADTLIYYSRQNGAPSVLSVSAVPEPGSMALVATALFGIAVVRRRKA